MMLKPGFKRNWKHKVVVLVLVTFLVSLISGCTNTGTGTPAEKPQGGDKKTAVIEFKFAHTHPENMPYSIFAQKFIEIVTVS